MLHVREVLLHRVSVELTPKEQTHRVEVAFQLPAAYDPTRVLIPTVSLWGSVFAAPADVDIEDRDGDGVRELIAQFDSTAFWKEMPHANPLTVTVTGEVEDTVWFRGAQELRFERLELVSPSGREFFFVGDSIPVDWTTVSGGQRADYALWVSHDGGASWSLVAEAIGGHSIAWTVTGPSTGEARLRVYARQGGEIVGFGTSAVDFVIATSLGPPAVVDTLRIAKGSEDVVLSWQPPDVGPDHGPATAYRVFASDAAEGPFTEVGSTDGTTWVEPLEAPARFGIVYYRIVASNAAGEGGEDGRAGSGPQVGLRTLPARR
jgi:hypothetical protein